MTGTSHYSPLSMSRKNWLTCSLAFLITKKNKSLLITQKTYWPLTYYPQTIYGHFMLARGRENLLTKTELILCLPSVNDIDNTVTPTNS